MTWASVDSAASTVVGMYPSEGLALQFGDTAFELTPEQVAVVNGGGRLTWSGASVAPDVDLEEQWAWERLRAERDIRLSATDKFVLPDYPISEEMLTAVKDYRTALRNLPEATADPFNPEWPVSPV